MSTEITPRIAKDRSEKLLQEHGLKINDELPLLENPAELSPQSSHVVAHRCIILIHIMGIGYGQSGMEIKKFLKDINLYQDTTLEERYLLEKKQFTEQETIDTTWLIECIQAFGWTMGLVDLDPFKACDQDLASHFPEPYSSPEQFIKSAKLRPFCEIYQYADLYYRLHWITRDSRLFNFDCMLDEGVIKERRKTLEWTIGTKQDWDMIILNT